jgi:tetratricopeptide (TPR) repeat protein
MDKPFLERYQIIPENLHQTHGCFILSCVILLIIFHAASSLAETGSVYITSNPTGANISLDNNPLPQKTDVLIEGLPIGPHHVRVEHPNHGKIEKAIEIRADLTLPVHFDLGSRETRKGKEPKEARDATDYHSRGFSYFGKNQYDLAIDDFTKAIKLDPKFLAAHYNRGIAYFELGQYDLSIADFTKAMELGLKGKGAYYIRGLAYSGNGQYDLSIEDFSKVIELDPQDAIPYNNRGVIYLLKGQYKQTMTDLTRAMELDPKKAARYHFYLGFVSDKMEDRDGARSNFLKAREIDQTIVSKEAEFLERQTSRENRIFYAGAMLSASKYLSVESSFVKKAEEILKAIPPRSPSSPSHSQSPSQRSFSQGMVLTIVLASGGMAILIVLLIKFIPRRTRGNP